MTEEAIRIWLRQHTPDRRPLWERALDRRSFESRIKRMTHHARVLAWSKRIPTTGQRRRCTVCGKRPANFGDAKPLCREHWVEGLGGARP